jgi:hypothetical protein
MKMSKPICLPKKVSRSFCTSTRELGALCWPASRGNLRTVCAIRQMSCVRLLIRAARRKLAFVLTSADEIDQGPESRDREAIPKLRRFGEKTARDGNM